MNYQTRIGHAHLKVRDLDRATAFYTHYFSLQFVERVGDMYVFLTGGDLHHEIALQNVGAYAPIPPKDSPGLYHVAFEVPDKVSFAKAFKTLTDAGIKVALVDHCISWAMYFDDLMGTVWKFIGMRATSRTGSSIGAVSICRLRQMM